MRRGAQGQAAFEVAVSYAQQRQAFGSPIASLQAIQLKLSEMGTRLHSAREPPRYVHRWHLGCILLKVPAVSVRAGLATWHAAQLQSAGEPFTREPTRYRCHLGCILLKMAAVSLLPGEAAQVTRL